MDSLEKFILEHREEFDTAMPNLSVWANIDRQLDKKPNPSITWMARLKVAAAVALLLTAGGVIGAYLATSSAKANTLADLSPEYAEMERYFNTQANQKMAQLASYHQDGFVRGDIQEMDAFYEELKTELQKVPPGSEEKIIQAMIKNYQTKIDMLDQVLEQVQTTNSTNLKTEEDEIRI